MKKKTITGHVALIEANGAEQCGGVVARTKRPPVVVSFKNTLLEMMSKKKKREKILRTSSKLGALFAKKPDTRQMSVLRIQTLELVSILLMNRGVSPRTSTPRRS